MVPLWSNRHFQSNPFLIPGVPPASNEEGLISFEMYCIQYINELMSVFNFFSFASIPSHS